MKLAIVHDYLNQMGGAENVLLVLHEIFPDAPVYTSIYAPELVHPDFRKMDVRTTFMQRLPLVHTHHQPFLPIYPFAFESLDLREYDVVLSMSSGWSKNVLTRPETCHVCYCLTPMRFGWSFEDYVARERVSGWQRAALLPIVAALRVWDVIGANRVDHFATLSTTVQRRIAKYYRREATLIYPPVETERYRPARGVEPGDYFLSLGRLIPYKRIDLAIEACNRLRVPLKVVGEGRDRRRLEAMAGPTVEFMGAVDEDTKRRLLQECRAFIFPGEEDFGITPVEAMAAGRPVVAFAGGGALDTVIEGTTGLLFRQPTAESLAGTLARVGGHNWESAAIAAHASQFGVGPFKIKLRSFVETKAAEHRAAYLARQK